MEMLGRKKRCQREKERETRGRKEAAARDCEKATKNEGKRWITEWKSGSSNVVVGGGPGERARERASE